ncbi:cadmium resistance transporter [Calothrix sp. PCC 7507]|uniref:cadmium resistance transporter n=1 Tax=Calothrix sp. PCC 7507 TaxID=99598 RepID=UPI00029F1A57|nr:cadmium resistance transporter [Calothrix sp. PCC 7507]AFY31845.1 cadmium resistance transporter [Calothrix sp. PCC 7507]
MSQLGTALTEGIIAFAATNIDDIIILLLFFSQVDANFRRRHVVIGQYLGFTAIIIASLPGFFGGLVIRRELIGLLGLLPIAIGFKQLLHQEPENTEIQTVTTDFKQSSPHNPILSFLFSILHPQTYKVVAVTVANGGDNISIYIPLFAGHSFASLGIILSVFLVMLGFWCAIAYWLSRHASIAYILSRYGKHVIPFVLISLGLFIMYERGTFSLLPWVNK